MERNTSYNSLEKLVTLLGGLENMRKNYPETYKAYEKTKTAMDNHSDPTPSAGSAYFFVAGIGYKDETKTQISVDYYVECDEESNALFDVKLFSVQAVSKDGEIPLSLEVSDMAFQQDPKINSVLISVKDVPLSAVKLKPYLCSIGEKVDTFDCYAPLDTYDLESESIFDIKHPSHQKTEAGTPIHVEYHSRYHFDVNECDYFYDDNATGGSFHNGGYFTLENEGSLKVLNRQVKSVDTHKLDYWIGDKHTIHTFNDSCIKIKDGNTIEWKLKPRSETLLCKFLLYTRLESLTYNLYMEVVLDNNKRAPFRITNDPKGMESERQIAILDPIMLFCDCLLKGSEITMEDGKKRKIETLSAGERVKSGFNSGAAIKKIGGGMNTVLVVSIKGENGKVIQMSHSHTVVTDTGLRHSQLVQVGDTLFTVDGSTVTVSSVEISEAKACELYYVELDCENGRLYLDGIQIGDSVATMTAAERYNNKLVSLPKNWQTDFKSWNAQQQGEEA